MICPAALTSNIPRSHLQKTTKRDLKVHEKAVSVKGKGDNEKEKKLSPHTKKTKCNRIAEQKKHGSDKSSALKARRIQLPMLS